MTETAIDLAIIWALLGITLALLFAAKPIVRAIGDSGVSVLSRIMGLILAAVAVDSVLVAIAQFFKISSISQQGMI